MLLPNDPQTFYRSMDLVTPEQLDRLQSATIEITNYHAFIRREKEQAAALTKKILAGPGGDLDRFKETSGEMVRRVCRVFGNAKDIVVLNDEAHHCYTPAPPEEAAEGGLDADERTEARKNAEEARVWFDGLRAVREKIGIRTIFDVSATPFFLKGSGYPEGTLFPWVVSDFGLMDAIESGIVKVPRVPGGGRLDGRRPAQVPRSLGPRARRAAAQGPQGHDRGRGRPGAAQGARGRPGEPVRRLRSVHTESGTAPGWAARRCSSSCAPTPA